MRRLLVLSLMGLALAGCASSVPGGKVVTPTPSTVIGKLQAPPYAGGNAVAGKEVFATSGCSACHTYAPAGSKGTIGPNLDDLASYAAKAGVSLDQYVYSAIVSPPAPYIPKGDATTGMPTTFGTSLKPAQVADLVAFLTTHS